MEIKNSEEKVIQQIATEVFQEHQRNCPMVALLNSKLDAIDSKLSELRLSQQNIHNKLFVGNGTPAIITRLDRIEQDFIKSSAKHDRWFWIAMPVIFTAIISISCIVYQVKSEQSFQKEVFKNKSSNILLQ